ncbi:MAG: penicillin-binding protein [Candidatus Pacebacteria bacterium]|nr:penicillin-binding protein [Candidatus Paceibacterota bacterium]
MIPYAKIYKQFKKFLSWFWRAVFSRKSRRSFFRHAKPVILLGIASCFVLSGVILIWASFITIPDFNNFSDRKVVESTKIYDRTGKILLYDVHDDVKRTIVPFEEISPYVKEAAIAVEDASFYSNYGIDPKSILRAIIADITGAGLRQGGSTITQQVVKKTLLTDEKTITRKIKEIILSLKLGQAYTKDQILAIYLNEIPYGGNVYGIGEASKMFFGKEPKDITLPESAYLAAIPNAPTHLSPYGNNLGDLEDRKNFVLKRMHTVGFITDAEYESALTTKVEFLPREPRGMKAPHFVVSIKEYLADKYGDLAVEENGYRVTTTLDYELQKKAEEVIEKFGPDVEKNFEAKNMGLVAIDPRTGQVLAMVGSRDYFDVANEGNFNVTLAHRQPGSTIKPFVYATAFNKGYQPETTLFDLRTNFSTNCDAKGVPMYPNIKPEDCYMPENYDGKYRGPVTLREALAQSLNVPSVKTLYLAGIKDSIETAKKAGITSLTDPARYGLTLVLGGGEVSLMELTGGYGVFANDGVRNPTTSILKVEDKNGNTVEGFSAAPEDAIPAETARKITSILSDNVARTPEFGSNSALYFPENDVAVKTGTTNDYRDVWTVGYTPNIAVGMWAGNNDNSKMQKNIAGMIIAPVWHAFMEEALKLYPGGSFTPPDQVDLTSFPAPIAGVWQGGEKYVIDTSSGNLATANTPIEFKKIVVVPSVHTILQWVNRLDPLGPAPLNPQNDSQYSLWETPVREWVATQKIAEGDRSKIPTQYDTNHNPGSGPNLVVSGIDFAIPHSSTERLLFTVTSVGSKPLSKVEFYINGQFVEKVTEAPFSFSFTGEDVLGLLPSNDITLVGYDSILNKSEYTAKLLIN